MGRKRKGLPINGWINLDKPLGITSTQAIGKLRRIFQPQKIGHAGTLDPLATGILPIAMGEATKTIPFIQDARKTYDFTITWGERRSTDDAEGEVIATCETRPSESAIKAALPQFIGDIEQIPPAYSAIKLGGKRAYDLARAGETVDIKARTVSIHDLYIITTDKHTATLRMECGKGTYVRSLGRDLAHTLGTEGYISMLRRIKVGPFTQDNAISLAILEKMKDSSSNDAALQPIESALDDILALSVDQADKTALGHGRGIPAPPSLTSKPPGTYVLMRHNDKPVALAMVTEDGALHPARVFNIDK